jgi:hypothetical protein
MSYSGRKDRARRIPQEKGIPRKLELRQIIIKINIIVLPLQFNDYYIACAVTSNMMHVLHANHYPFAFAHPKLILSSPRLHFDQYFYQNVII